MGESLEIIDVSCENCVGACCRAGILQLTEREAYMNRRKMNLVRQVKARRYPQQVIVQAEGFNDEGERIPIPTPMTIGRDYGLYLLPEDCGHLTDDNKCGVYGERTRPRACLNYEVGGSACLGARQAAGLIDLTPPGIETSD